jgi:hypothetical protein
MELYDIHNTFIPKNWSSVYKYDDEEVPEKTVAELEQQAEEEAAREAEGSPGPPEDELYDSQGYEIGKAPQPEETATVQPIINPYDPLPEQFGGYYA